MAITYSAKGTSFPSFQVGRRGITILQGTTAPLVGQGVDGDMFVQAGSTPALWQKVSGAWNKIGNFGSKIFTGTTSVDTAEVANTITFNANGKRIANIVNDAASVNGEKVTIKNGAANITMLVEDSTGTNPVDLVIDLQGQGVLKVQSDADAAIRTSDGSPITIQPGTKTEGAGGETNIIGGSTTAANQVGGNVVLQPGASGSGAAAAQVIVPSGYAAVAENSVVSRIDQANWLTSVVTVESSRAVAANEQIMIVKRSSATEIVLPVSATVGRQIKIKNAGSGSVSITVSGGATIDGVTSFPLTDQWAKATFVWDGVLWQSI